MSDSYTNLLYHIVFSTKDRRPIIKPEHEVRLYDYIGGIIRRVGGISLELNGTDDHIHLLVPLRPDRAVSDVLRDLRQTQRVGCMTCFHRSKTFRGNVLMERSL